MSIVSVYPLERTEAQLERLQVLSQEWQLSEHPFWSYDSILDAFNRRGPKIFFASDSAKGVWQGMVFIDQGFDFTDILYIYVSLSARSQGIAPFLLEHIFKEVATERWLLEVRPSNQRALKLYKNFSFREISRRISYYSDGEDALILERVGS